MSNVELDLNIDNYDLPEIETFLKVTPPYTLNDVINNEKLIVSVISKDAS